MNEDVVADPVTEFESLFEPGAEHPDASVLGALLDELATSAHEVEELDEDLVGVLMELAVAGRTSEAERCAGYLTTLAGRLAGRPRAVLATGVDLVLGGLAAEQERWDEAVVRSVRARAAIRPDLFPDHVSQCEMVLGDAAAHRNDVSAAVRHWEAALAGFVGIEMWRGAATAAGRLAELAEVTEGDGERTQRLWRQAADLSLDAGETREAFNRATHSCQLTLAELNGMPDTPDVAPYLAQALVAREFAVRHRVGPAGVALLTTAAHLGSADGMPWEQIVGWLALARQECREVGPDADQIEQYLAVIDLIEGGAAVGRNLWLEAEAPLRAARPVFCKYGQTDREQICAQLLSDVLVGLADAERGAIVATGRTWTDPDTGAGALLVQAVHALNDGRLADARALAGQAKELAAQSGREELVLALEAFEAGCRLEEGDQDSVRRQVDRIDEQVRTAGPTHRPAVRNLEMLAGLLRVGLAQRTVGRARSVPELERLEAQMLQAGAGLLAAQVAVQRGRALLEQDRAKEATRVLVPAVLALDAVRFSLDDAGRRERWSAAAAEAFDTTFRAAAAAGEPRLLAELIEVARANAVPTPRTADGASSVIDELVAESERASPREEQPPAELGALAGAAVLAGREGRTELGLPANLRTPWDTIALAEHLDLARRYHDPVRAGLSVDWVVRTNPPSSP